MPFSLGFWAAAGAGGGAAAGAYELISTTLGTSPLTFSSIPSTYKHLQLRIVQRSSGSTQFIRFNGDTGSNYVRHELRGNGTNVTSSASTAQTYIAPGFVVNSGGTPSGAHSAFIIDILDYASTTNNKTVRMFGGGLDDADKYIALNSGLWLSTAAINSIGLTYATSTSRFSLYGVKG